jgi:dTMP kinase
MQTGMMIILEGGEGAGKTTLARNFAEALTAEGYEVVLTREPGGTPWGEKVRGLLLDKDPSIDHRMAPSTQLLGHYMARFEHIERVIVPALASGKIVMCDRFEVSSYAYQVAAQDETLLELFKALHTQVLSKLRPYTCAYAFCDLSPEKGLARITDRPDRNIFDDEVIEFHQRVYQGIQEAKHHLDSHYKWFVIDASQSQEAMLQSLREKMNI